MQIKVGMRVKLKESLNKRMQGVPLIISEIKQDMIYLLNVGWFHVSLIDWEETKKLNEVKEEPKDNFELKPGMKYVLETGIVRELREIKDGLCWSTKGTNCKETYINWIETRKLNTNQKPKEESKKSITITLDLNKQQELLKRTKKH